LVNRFPDLLFCRRTPRRFGATFFFRVRLRRFGNEVINIGHYLPRPPNIGRVYQCAGIGAMSAPPVGAAGGGNGGAAGTGIGCARPGAADNGDSPGFPSAIARNDAT
jgi:hypothetical protein